MRRGIRWALGLTGILTIAALWSGEAPRVVSAIEPPSLATESAQNVTAAASPTTAPPFAMLPAELPRNDVEPAKRDVFVPTAPPPPPPSPPIPSARPPATPVQAPLPPAPPQAPALNVRFLGSMLTPAGERLVYLARGDDAVLVAVGNRLDEGYVVTELTADAVTLTHPPSQTRVVVTMAQATQP